jgi:hypothetical protein
VTHGNIVVVFSVDEQNRNLGSAGNGLWRDLSKVKAVFPKAVSKGEFDSGTN